MKKIIYSMLLIFTMLQVNAQDQPQREQQPQRPGTGQRKQFGKQGQGGPMDRRGGGPEAGKRIEMFKIQFINKKLALTSEEAEAFWPIYEDNKKAMENILKTKTSDEIVLQEALLNAKKVYRNKLKPVLKSDERVNEALKIDREFLRKMKGEMMRRRGGRN
jgi:hypothetical protein